MVIQVVSTITQKRKPTAERHTSEGTGVGKVGFHLLFGRPLPALSSLSWNPRILKFPLSPPTKVSHPHHMAAFQQCPGLTAFDLALLCICRDKEGLSEEPEDIDQPEKRQESKTT